MSSVPREVVDCGIQDSQYRRAIATTSYHLLSNISSISLKNETALIVPAMKSPFPRLLSRRTPFDSIFVVDSSDEDLQWQSANIEEKEKCIFIVGDESNLPMLQDIGFILNPFGLQHYPDRCDLFGERVRKLTHDRALLATLDWGVTTYPEDLKNFPGISNEVQHSESLQLPPFDTADGWKQMKEMEFTFFVRHTVDEVSVLLISDHGRQLRENFGVDRNIEVGSSIIYRLYEAR